jgi:hypothetical protein
VPSKEAVEMRCGWFGAKEVMPRMKVSEMEVYKFGTCPRISHYYFLVLQSSVSSLKSKIVTKPVVSSVR